VRARLITRCGCERTMEVSFPPPPTFCLPLRPPKYNEGLVRPWMEAHSAQHYDPKRDGLQRRAFKLSEDSWAMYTLDPEAVDAEVWYDEIVDHDPPGYEAGRRTYAPGAAPKEPGT